MGAMSVVVTKAVASKIAIAVGEAQGRGKLLKNPLRPRVSHAQRRVAHVVL
jgi:hypothetical protein